MRACSVVFTVLLFGFFIGRGDARADSAALNLVEGKSNSGANVVNNYVAGKLTGTNGFEDIVTIKYDERGELEWSKEYHPGEGRQNVPDAATTSQTLDSPTALADTTPPESAGAYSSLNAAVNALATGGSITIDSPTILNADLVIPPKMRVSFAKSGSINLMGKTLTINGPFQAGLYQVFSGGGKVVFGHGVVKEVYPQWWYDGGGDYTGALQAAADTGIKVYLAEGTYPFTALKIHNQYANISGAGVGKAILQFMPSSDSTAVLVQAATAIPIVRGSITDLSIRTYDTTHTKIAINMVDTSEWNLERIEINCTSVTNSIWTGGYAGSVGIQFNGRELTSAHKLYISADRPVVIGPCPNMFLGVDIGLDHFSGIDWYLTAKGYPNIEILPNTPISNFNLGGSQAWDCGTYGLKWYNDISFPVSFAIHISNARWEQRELDSTGNPGWMFDIAYPSSNIRNVLLENITSAQNANGIRLRNVMWATIKNYLYPDNTLSSLDVDQTVYPLILENCFGEWGSKSSIVGLTESLLIPHTSTGSSLPLNAVYDKPHPSMDNFALESAYGIQGKPIGITSDSAVAITPNASLFGLVSITTAASASVLYFAKGTSGTLIEIAHSDPAWFSTAKDHPGTINTYLDADNKWYIQNKTTLNPLNVSWQSLGLRGSFQ